MLNNLKRLYLDFVCLFVCLFFCLLFLFCFGFDLSFAWFEFLYIYFYLIFCFAITLFLFVFGFLFLGFGNYFVCTFEIVFVMFLFYGFCPFFCVASCHNLPLWNIYTIFVLAIFIIYIYSLQNMPIIIVNRKLLYI